MHLLHGGGGGLEAVVRILADQLGAGFEHHLLFAHAGNWRLEGPDGGTVPLRFGWWNGPDRVVRRLGAAFVHVHHLPQGLPGLERLRVPYGVTVHDFHPVCPRNHLVPPAEVYCGAPEDVALCRRCLAAKPRLRVDPVRWRARHRELLESARFVAVPSRYAGEVLARHWPELRCIHVPHPYHPAGAPDEAPAQPDGQGLYPVAVVGALGREKGGEMLERLAARAEARELPVRFVMLGDTHRLGGPQSLFGGHLFVNGSYRREDLPGLLREHGAMLAAFPAIGPETFSLTLSEVWASGLPALVPDFGALAERVRDAGAGWTLADWQDPDAWLDALMERLSDPQALARAGRAARNAAAGPGEADYGALYREALGL
ncbi:glycosyltransferase [Thioalkalivibrio thiocyanodenitrificans]|uniref:glycosyltransferase n=1 Tax=Thioalkalivibrio thiocyanodenitrificans TaxID=243063 RepID=UPI0018DCEAFC|nr:glycosyltransferase [Thioalkalivibrio thiocyanodenitrificans]